VFENDLLVGEPSLLQKFLPQLQKTGPGTNKTYTYCACYNTKGDEFKIHTYLPREALMMIRIRQNFEYFPVRKI
jgi:hypothetical protein